MSYEVITEDVPAFVRRMGDRVIEGSNNTTIVLGTDRPAGVGTGLGHVKASGAGRGTGTIHMIVGRAGSDPDMVRDRAFLYISEKTDSDANLGTSAVGGASPVSSAAAVVADSVRVIAREDLKIVVGTASFLLKRDGTVTVEGNVKFGAAAVDRLVRESFLRHYRQHFHVAPSSGGPTGGPVQQILDQEVLTARCKSL